MTAEQLEQNLTENETKAISDIRKILSDYEMNIFNYLADIVSAMCGVEKKDMFSLDRKNSNVQARGLFFYACRYMTSYTYEKTGEIAEIICGKKFPAQYVHTSVVKIVFLIENTHMWSKRWNMLKIIIKSQMESKEQ